MSTHESHGRKPTDTPGPSRRVAVPVPAFNGRQRHVHDPGSECRYAKDTITTTIDRARAYAALDDWCRNCEPVHAPPVHEDTDLVDLDCIGPARLKPLRDAGITTLADLRNTDQDLARIDGISLYAAAQIRGQLDGIEPATDGGEEWEVADGD